MERHVVVEQTPLGFRYRVTRKGVLEGSSCFYKGFDDCVYALRNRFPSYIIDKIEVLG